MIGRQVWSYATSYSFPDIYIIHTYHDSIASRRVPRSILEFFKHLKIRDSWEGGQGSLESSYHTNY